MAPSATDVSTWTRTKDIIVIGSSGVAVLLALQILADVAALKRDIAVFNANVSALQRSHDQLYAEVQDHFKEDRAKFNTIGSRLGR